MIHKNVGKKPKKKAKLRAFGEIIRKNGDVEKIVLEGETSLSPQELEKQLNTKVTEEK